MKKFWQIAVHEYLHHVLRKRFLFALLSMPLFVVFILGVSMISVVTQDNPAPVGYVDYSWLLEHPVQLTSEEGGLFSPVDILAFSDEAAARQALESQKIQAYFIVPKDYLETGVVQAVALKAPSERAQSDFADLLRVNLLASQPDAVAQRVLEGDHLEIHSLDSQREQGSGQWLSLVLPVIAGVIFMIVINISGGYLLRAVVDEKENRTMEVLITSVSPTQLMAGKVVGNLSVGLTQLFIWLFFPAVAFLVARPFLPFLQGQTFDGGTFGLMVLTMLPAFVFVAALMAMVGATATESREAQQMAGLFSLPIMIPFWFTYYLMQYPNSPFSLILSVFPFTAPVSLPLRAAFTDVPGWQIALSLGILVASALGAVWLAGRAFRLGMLRYGKRLSWKELFGLS
ncbi:MAG: ABC transporter permease [Chloroflexi bacterium]|nr:ABC transporter permease [Chloroflexota bacterium]